MDFRVVIPARFHSSRLPGKVLLDIHGKPMIQHVYERAQESGAEDIVIATDDEKVKIACEAFGAHVVMTDPEHPTGTHRIAEVSTLLGWDDDEILVNVQADEPLIKPTLIRQVAEDLETHDNVKVTTVCRPITDAEEMFNPHIVKVVLNRRGYAMYFSRAPIPYDRDQFENWQSGQSITLNPHSYKHLGLYAYRVGFIQKYLEMDGCPEEDIEKLEQLRILWFGSKVHVAVTEKQNNIGVDTEDDLQLVRQLMAKKKTTA